MRFLLIVFLIMLVAPYVWRMIFPWLLRFTGRQIGKRMQQQQPGQHSRAKATNSAVQPPPPRHKKIDKNVGEYVEYEEIVES
ncbi:MAG: DUF4834 family protein [Prevotellaceae bacterium]|nr:DUF4834 family protein [Prevotellaceae bacterium]